MIKFIKYIKMLIVIIGFQTGIFTFYTKISDEPMYLNIQCSITEEDKSSETYQIFWPNDKQKYDAKNSYTYNYYENDINKTFSKIQPFINKIRFDPFVGSTKKNVRINKIAVKSGKTEFITNNFNASPKSNIKRITKNTFECTSIDPQIEISNFLPFSNNVLNLIFFNKTIFIFSLILGLILGYYPLKYCTSKNCFLKCSVMHLFILSLFLFINILYINNFSIEKKSQLLPAILSDILISLIAIILLNKIKFRLLKYVFISSLYLFIIIENHIYKIYKEYLNSDQLKYFNENKVYWLNNFAELFNFIDYIIILINAVIVFVIYLPNLRQNEKYFKFNAVYPKSFHFFGNFNSRY